MTPPRKVYVVELGCYDQRYVAGIYDSPERAMGAHPAGRWRRTRWADFPNWPDRTVVEYRTGWSNGLDWDAAAHIDECDLTESGPIRPAEEAVVQTYRESDGGWDYIPESTAG